MSYIKKMFRNDAETVKQGRVVGNTQKGELLVAHAGGAAKKVSNSMGILVGPGANVIVTNIASDQTALGVHGTRSEPKVIGVTG
jgi:hypothetical protein